MQDQGQVRVSLDEIRLGATCKFDIHDENGVLLLGNGRPLTAAVRDQILDRGTSFLEVSPEDAKALRGETPSGRRGGGKDRGGSGSIKARMVDRSWQAFDNARAETFRARVATTVSMISKIGNHLQDLSNEGIKGLCGVPATMLEMITDDPDQSLACMNAGKDEDHLASRCARMSLLGIGTAIELDLAEDDIFQIGMAGLLHDLGLYQFPEHFRDPAGMLTRDEAWEYRRHGSIGVNLVSHFSAVSEEVLLIMSQVHERPDGSGYPRGMRGRTIHPLSNILAIADAYLTLTDVGPGRPPVLPHDALVFLLHEGGRGKFDGTAMRAFLNHISLYPIGSNVRLSNGCLGVVMRRNPNSYATPIIQLCGNNDASLDHPPDELIHLDKSDLTITGVALEDDDPRMRIPREMMSMITMEMMEPSVA